MKTLTLAAKAGTFHLDVFNIGDYLEAEFLACTGLVGITRGVRGDKIPIVGYKLLLTLSANAAEPEIVLFTTSNRQNQQILTHREAGAKLTLTAVQLSNHAHVWYTLGINGEFTGLTGRQKVK